MPVDVFQNEDVFRSILVEWLELADLVHLDTAMVHREKRDTFLRMLRSTQYQIPFSNQINLWWKNHRVCLKWIVSRKMYFSQGMLYVNQQLWNRLIDDKVDDYKPFLRNVQKLRFDNANGFDFRGLENCIRLEELRLYNLTNAVPCTLEICPHLKTLYLQNSTVDKTLLDAFQYCTHLQDVTFYHVEYGNTITADTVRTVFASITSLKILGNVPKFLDTFCRFPDVVFPQLHTLTVDKVLQAESSAFDLSPILSKAPQLHTLHIERMMINYLRLFHLLARYCKSLYSLYLNHCRLDDGPAGGGVGAPVDGPGGGPGDVGVPTTATTAVITSQEEAETAHLQIGTLTLASLIGHSDHHIQNILFLARQSLTHLHLSFLSNLTDRMYNHIATVYPRIQTLIVEDKRVVWEQVDIAGRVQRVMKELSDIPRVRLILWEKWIQESEKHPVASAGNGYGWKVPTVESSVVYEHWK